MANLRDVEVDVDAAVRDYLPEFGGDGTGRALPADQPGHPSRAG